jgi:hypothetical protein
MLHKCANPDCSSVFRRLSHGKLFLLEIDQAMESSHRPSPTTPPNQPKRTAGAKGGTLLAMRSLLFPVHTDL